jgi:uncharacterized UPF0160 family protein
MSLFTPKKLLVTHNGTFHADDLFATAALSILLNGKINIVRTRDVDVIAKGDYVYDVGGEYDPARNRFDHHQKGGAGIRENGIPYAAFGLVWKTYGEQICGSKSIADAIDEFLVQAIDAQDNGVNTYRVEGPVGPYVIEGIVNAFRPSWKEGEEYDAPFFEVLDFFKKFLVRKIKKERDRVEAESFITTAYQKADDKRLIILDDQYPWRKTLFEHPEPLYVIVPKAGRWNVYCVQKEPNSFENRKSFPEAWAGLRDAQMAEVSGVPDAIFCHNGRFLAVAKSKEGALALAQKALAM